MTLPTPSLEYLMIVGALHVDDIATSHQGLIPRASNPVSRHQRVGGVAANAALAAVSVGKGINSKAGQHIAFAGAIGTDAVATQLENTLRQAGILPCLQHLSGCTTGRYIAVLEPDGELYLGLSDVALAESFDATKVPLRSETYSYQALLMDANLSQHCLDTLSELASAAGITLAAMSVSPAKSTRLLSMASSLDLMFCNRREAIALAAADFAVDAHIDQLADALLERGFSQFVLTDATSPVVVHSQQGRQYVPVPKLDSSSSVNGAGDALAGATFAAWCAGTQLADAVCHFGLPQAARVVSGEHVPTALSV